MWKAFVDVIQGRFFCHSTDNFKLSVGNIVIRQAVF